jgi:cohesin loading factor subunit SCC2
VIADLRSLLLQIFGQHEEQRPWIIQEILTSLIKLPEIKKAQKQFK